MHNDGSNETFVLPREVNAGIPDLTPPQHGDRAVRRLLRVTRIAQADVAVNNMYGHESVGHRLSRRRAGGGGPADAQLFRWPPSGSAVSVRPGLAEDAYRQRLVVRAAAVIEIDDEACSITDRCHRAAGILSINLVGAGKPARMRTNVGVPTCQLSGQLTSIGR
jgi:hypothetical protein